VVRSVVVKQRLVIAAVPEKLLALVVMAPVVVAVAVHPECSCLTGLDFLHSWVTVVEVQLVDH